MTGKRIVACLACLLAMLAGIGISFYYAFCESGAYYSNDVWSRVWIGSAITATVVLGVAWYVNYLRFRTKPTAEIWIVICLMVLVTGRYFVSISEGKSERRAIQKNLNDLHEMHTAAAFSDFDPTDTRLLQMASPLRARERLTAWFDTELGRSATPTELDKLMGLARAESFEFRLDDTCVIVRENNRLRMIKKLLDQ